MTEVVEFVGWCWLSGMNRQEVAMALLHKHKNLHEVRWTIGGIRHYDFLREREEIVLKSNYNLWSGK